MKRKMAMLLSWMLVLTMLAACASGNNNEGTDAGKSNTGGNEGSGEVVNLTMWGGVPAESGPQAVVDVWNAENPNIQVEYVRYVNDDDGNLKLDTALLTGQDADLFVNYSIPRVEKRIEMGVALDLSTFEDYNIDEKMGSSAEGWKIDGKYYGVPTKKNVFFVALNKDALDEAGLEIPTDWTWDEMRDYAKKLTKEGRYGLVQHTEPFVDPIDSVMVKEGYTKENGESNLNHPLVVQWMETLQAMMSEDKSTPPLGEQLTTKMPVDTMFLKGEAAMLNIGEWLIRSSNDMEANPRDFKIAFAPVPKLSEEVDITRGGLGDYVSVNAKSGHTKEAWEFLKWYADGGMAPMAAGGRLPASKDADLEAATKSLLGDHADTYDEESLKRILFEDQSEHFVRNVSQQLMDVRQEEYEKFFLGAQSAEEAAQNMADRHTSLLK
ncbi:ABC transporter substrate-binding protein [Marinicrinis sediminis]|uniref:ABC transporter substrate-binding protein n=1 Tax=Marinicrinis sediminis TaxID=1652465 RepID=A0ABW5RAC2_9BACL